MKSTKPFKCDSACRFFAFPICETKIQNDQKRQFFVANQETIIILYFCGWQWLNDVTNFKKNALCFGA